MIRGTFEVHIEFGADGNGESVTLGGWSRPEREYTFNNGHEAHLMLPKLFDSDRYDMSIDVWPFVVPDRVPVQHFEVVVRGTPVLQAAVDSRERRIIACEIPPHVVEGCESLHITFRFPDAAVPASLAINSTDTRVLAFAVFGVTLSGHLAGDAGAVCVGTE